MMTVFSVVDFVHEQIPDRPKALGRIEYVAVAFFAGDGRTPLRCVDYHVRAVEPTTDPTDDHIRLAIRQMTTLDADSITESWVHALPPGGIPRSVLNKASKRRLLAKAQQRAKTPKRMDTRARRLLATSLEPANNTGRPSKRDLRRDLETLETVAQLGAEGATLLSIAEQLHISRSTLRDLLHWARHTARPTLLMPTTAGSRGPAVLTDEARDLLAEMRRGDV